MFSSFFSNKNPSEQKQHLEKNYLPGSLWHPEIYKAYRNMINSLKPTASQRYFRSTTNSASNSGPEKIIEKAESFYAAGEYGLKHTNHIQDVERKKLVLRNDEILEPV